MNPVKILRLPHACPNSPNLQSTASTLLTLQAAIPENDPIVLMPLERRAFPSGFALELQDCWEGQILSIPKLVETSGLAVLNSPGTIDPDYRGEVMVILINLGNEKLTIKRCDPIAYMKFAQFVRARLLEVDTLSPSARGHGGLGSTG